MANDGFDKEERQTLRLLFDRQAVRRCIETYFHALDSPRFELLDEAFAPEIDLGNGVPPTPI
jgi:hypothetical protein